MPKFDGLSNPMKWVCKLIMDPIDAAENAMTEHVSKLTRRPICSASTVHYENIKNQRSLFPDVPCLDETRVKLTTTRDGNDFIHANWVKLPHVDYNFILAQGPSKETASDFWSMIWQEKITLVICLSRLAEFGRPRAFEYWPTTSGNEHRQQYNHIHVRNIGIKNSRYMALSVLDAINSKTRERRTVLHYFYMDWFDHNAPACVHDLLTFIEYINNEVRNLKTPPGTPTPTILVHSSSGTARAGTMAALLSLMGTVNQGGIPNVCETVGLVRKQRAMAVQNIRDYFFIYHALSTYIIKNSTLSLDWKSDASFKLSNFHDYSTNSQCDAKRSSSPEQSKDKKKD